MCAQRNFPMCSGFCLGLRVLHVRAWLLPLGSLPNNGCAFPFQRDVCRRACNFLRPFLSLHRNRLYLGDIMDASVLSLRISQLCRSVISVTEYRRLKSFPAFLGGLSACAT
jgi:hypothetical protein